MKRSIAPNKRQYGISLEEVKKVMSFDVYKTLYDLIYQVEGEHFLFHMNFINGMEFDDKKRKLRKHAY